MANKLKKRTRSASRSAATDNDAASATTSTTTVTQDTVVDGKNEQENNSVDKSKNDEKTDVSTDKTSQKRENENEESFTLAEPKSLPTSQNEKSVRFASVDIFEFERCQGFGSIPGNYAPFNETITLGMQLKHGWQESFATIDDYLKYKRRADLDKLESYVHQCERERQKRALSAAIASEEEYTTTTTSADETTTKTVKTSVSVGEETNEENDEDIEDPEMAAASLLEQQEESMLESAKEILAHRHVFENDLELDLYLHPDISCPVLTNEERIEKLLSILAPKEENETSEDDSNGVDLPVSIAESNASSSSTTLSHFDRNECEEVNEILKSREICGCDCRARNQLCNTDACSCFANGINCQIDRCKPSYPCGCNLSRCKNPFGMKHFNWRRVDKHKNAVLKRFAEGEAEQDVVKNATAAAAASVTESLNQPEEAAANQEEPKQRKKRRSSMSTYSPHKRRKKTMTNSSSE